MSELSTSDKLEIISTERSTIEGCNINARKRTKKFIGEIDNLSPTQQKYDYILLESNSNEYLLIIGQKDYDEKAYYATLYTEREWYFKKDNGAADF